jgi:hypothetical protein
VIRPLTEEATVDALPSWATLEQISYYWGTPDRIVNRLAISAGGLVVTSILSNVLFNHLLTSLLNVVFFFYWLLEPAFMASRRNLALRRFPYIGLFCGTIREAYISEAVLYRERVPGARRARFREVVQKRINVVAADPSGRRITISGPFRSQEHRLLAPGQEISMLIASDVPDFARVGGVSDACVRVQRLTASYEHPVDDLRYRDEEFAEPTIADDDFIWIGDYPFVNKEFFLELFEAALGPQPGRAAVAGYAYNEDRPGDIGAYARRGGQRDYSRSDDDNDDSDYRDDGDDDEFDDTGRYRRRAERRVTKRKTSRARRPVRPARERSAGGNQDGDDDQEETPWFDEYDRDTDDSSDFDLDEDDQDDPKSWRYVRTVPGKRVQPPENPRRGSSPPSGADDVKKTNMTDSSEQDPEAKNSESKRAGAAPLESMSSEKTLSKTPERSNVD